MQISRANRSIDKIISDSKKDAEKKRVMRSNPPLKEKHNLEEAERNRVMRSNPPLKEKHNLEEAERKRVMRSNPPLKEKHNLEEAERNRVMRSNPPLKEKHNLEEAERMRQKMSNPENKDQQNQRMRDRRSNVDFDTGFEAICCCCLEYKSSGQSRPSSPSYVQSSGQSRHRISRHSGLSVSLLFGLNGPLS